jgi:histidine triad (HIT) family protein
METACIFCKIISGNVPSFPIAEGKEWLAFLDVTPITAGHLLLIPKVHHDDIYMLDEDIYHTLFTVARTLGVKLRHATGAKRIGLAIEGFGVPHVHIHLVPINQGNELDPHRATPMPHDELAKIRENLLPFFTEE